MTKKLLIASGALTICTGAVLNILLSQQKPLTPQEELTLANIEALGLPAVEYENIKDGKVGWCVGVKGVCDEPFPGHTIPGSFVPREQ